MTQADARSIDGDSVLLLGTFDVENYGDLLFPLIARHRLERAGLRVVAVSPTAAVTRYVDAVLPVDVATAFASRPKAVLIGGGSIVHARPTTLADYARAGVGEGAYASLWIGGSLLAAAQDIPACWNAPGVPKRMPSRVWRLAQRALAAADYVAVRDRASAANLRDHPNVRVAPDTAAGLAELWPRETLAAVRHEGISRRGGDPAARYLAVHVKERSIVDGIDATARAIDEMAARLDCVPLLLALGRCHGDEQTAVAVAAKLSLAHVSFADSSELREIAAAIAGAHAYVGTSLHGYVTARAYGVPTLLVTEPNPSKFAGFAELTGGDDDLVPSWRAAAERVATSPLPSRLLADGVRRAVDAHWDEVAAGLSANRRLRRDERIRLLREYARAAIGQPDWQRAFPTR